MEKKMILELITPLMLATAPMTILVKPMEYSHQQQTIVQQDYQVAQWSKPLPTYNGTRTFSPSGQPSDNDND